MSDCAVGLSIFDILAVARDYGLPLLPESDTQYSEYLETCITEAMEEDAQPFRRPDFITKFGGNSRLLQLMWKTVMSNYTVASAPVSAELTLENGTETPLAESLLAESEVSTQHSLHQLPSPTESVVNSPAISKEVDDLNEPERLDLDSSTPASLEIQAEANLREPDPSSRTDVGFNDDFGLPAIEPTIEQPSVLKPIAAAAEEIKKPEHVRADSVVEEDAVTPDNSFEIAKHDAVGELVPVVSNGNHDSVKKHKKKGKKKHSSIVF